MSGKPILRTLAIAASAALLVTALAVPVTALDWSPDGPYLAIGGTVDEDVKAKGEDIVITGTVNGNVIQRRAGSVIVDGGTVTGRVRERGAGDVRVINGGRVHGSVIEEGRGDVEVNGSTVEGKVKEKGPGDIRLIDSTVGGKVKERGKGKVITIRPPGPAPVGACTWFNNPALDGVHTGHGPVALEFVGGEYHGPKAQSQSPFSVVETHGATTRTVEAYWCDMWLDPYGIEPYYGYPSCGRVDEVCSTQPAGVEVLGWSSSKPVEWQFSCRYKPICE